MSSYQPRWSRCSVSIYLQSSPSRICHCPASPDIVFTSGPRCGLNVFDLRTQPASPVDTFMHPLASFQDCGATSSALDWSIINEGYVASGSDNGKVCVWDALNQYKSPVVEFSPPQEMIVRVGRFRPFITECVCWHPSDSSLIFSSDMSGNVHQCDLRQKAQTCILKRDEACLCVSVNPVERFLLATAGGSGSVCLWDNRNLSHPLHTMIGHAKAVNRLRWNPFNCSSLASCGMDGRVCLWDLGRIGSAITPEQEREGPPELVFVHGGHTDSVIDVSWNPNVLIV